MATLTSEQQRVLSHIHRVAKQVGASPKEVKAAVETGLVESNLTNPSGGDADSGGWRQERRSLYKDPTNLDASIRRFFSEASAVKAKYGRAGDLAAAVQRPAAQYRGRYQANATQAAVLLERMGRGSSAPTGARGSKSRTVDLTTSTPTLTTSFDKAGYEQARRRAVLGHFLAKDDPGSLLLKAGAVSTTAPSEADFTEQKVGSKTAVDSVKIPGAAAAPKSAAKAHKVGQVKIAAGAEREGVGLQKSILGFLHQVAGVSGREVDVTTGTNHSRMTTSGNVSDHWGGNAADLGVGGDARQDESVGHKGDLIAAHAIQVASGKSFKDALALARKGGVFNFETPRGRVQILWRTLVGGDHYNHVHVGVRP